MTKLLVVSPMWPNERSPSFGVFVKNVCHALESHGFEIATAVIAGRSRTYREKLVTHARLGARILSGAFGDADCIYLNAPSWFASLVELVAMARRLPVVVHLHGSEVFPSTRVEHLSQASIGSIVRRARLVIVPSNYYAEQVQRRFGVAPARLFVSPSGGVDLDVFTPSSGDARRRTRRQYGLPEDGPTVGFVGRIDREKGCFTFVEALEHLARAFPTLHALVIGEGPDRDQFLREVTARGLTDRVRMVGFLAQPALARAYPVLDVLLFPTWRESLGLVAIEAMACGVPVVASNTTAVPEYVHDGKSGFLVPLGDAEAFAACTTTIFTMDDSGREALRSGARRVAQRYDSITAARDLVAAIRAASD